MDYMNQILHGDCLKIMPQIPDNCVDLILSSPPLDYLKIDWIDYWEWMHKVIKECERVLKTSGLIILFYPFKYEDKILSMPLIELYNICNLYTMLVPYQLKLVDSGGIFFIAFKEIKPKFRVKESIVKLEYEKNIFGKWKVESIEKILATTTNIGDFILDPFCGYGNFCLAASNLECNFCGIDIDKERCENACRIIK